MTNGDIIWFEHYFLTREWDNIEYFTNDRGIGGAITDCNMVKSHYWGWKIIEKYVNKLNVNNDDKGLYILKFNHAGALELKDGNIENYGVIRIDKKQLVCYTAKGLSELWNQTFKFYDVLDTLSEQKYINSGHIKIISLDQIERVIF